MKVPQRGQGAKSRGSFSWHYRQSWVHSSTHLSSPRDDTHAIWTRDDGSARHRNEQSVLDDSRYSCKAGGKRLRIIDPLKRCIEDQVATIRDERMAVFPAPQHSLARTTRRRCSLFHRPLCHRKTKGDDLNG